MDARNYQSVDLFGHTNKFSSYEKQFYESILDDINKGTRGSPFLRLFETSNNAKKSESVTISVRRRSTDSSNDEPQSFLEWKSLMSWAKISSWKAWRRLRKTTIYLLPVGPFPDFIMNKELNLEQVSIFELLVRFGEAFFPGIRFIVLPAVEYKEIGCRTRYHRDTRQLQIFVNDVLDQIDKARPKDGYAIVALPWVDLYPDEKKNHVAGESCFQTGCGALGFCHYVLRKRRAPVQARIDDRPRKGCTELTVDCDRYDEESCWTQGNDQWRVSVSKRRSYNDKQYKDDGYEVLENIDHSKAETVSLNERTTKEYLHAKLAHLKGKIGLRKFSSGLKLPPMYTMPGMRSQSYTDLTSEKLMTIDKELKCSFLSLKELDRRTRLSSSSWLQLFSEDSSGFSSSFEDFEIIHTAEDSLSVEGLHELVEDDSVIEALPYDASFIFNCDVLWRLMRALSHEVGHLFGLAHCFFYQCAMNSSSSIEEAVQQPLFLCPVCLRKVERMLKFDIKQRYLHLQHFLDDVCNLCTRQNHTFSQCTVSRYHNIADGVGIHSPVQSCHFDQALKKLNDILERTGLALKR